MPSTSLALFEAFPGLRRSVPRHPVLGGPTPVEPLRLDGVSEGALWIKRDDSCCPAYGGNKPRKLEFVLGDARTRGARRLVTVGAIGTHHGLATTILGREAGLATTVVMLGQPPTPAVRETLLLHAAYGATLVYGRNVPGIALGTARALAGAFLRGERPYYVAAGGSSLRGCVGFVSAALELAAQVRAGACPEPLEIYVAVGTGGTLAGLAAGLEIAGLRSRVVGVRVSDILPPGRRKLARTAARTLAWLHRRDPAFPAALVPPERFELVTDRVGAGYGAPSEAGRAAVAAAESAGIRLENTYTGKCLAEVRDRAARGALPDGPVLFWNTYNGVDVAARAPAPLDPALLPRRLRRFVE